MKCFTSLKGYSYKDIFGKFNEPPGKSFKTHIYIGSLGLGWGLGFTFLTSSQRMALQ